MKNAFFEECGRNPESLGDVSARLNAVASEIYSMYCNMDYVARQSFIQTAQGEYLDYHAQLRNMSRKSASKATGKLTFSIPLAIDESIVIPKGTICSVKDKPFIQYETDEDAVLEAGKLSVSASATALDTGDTYNVDENMVTVLVSSPARIESVTNTDPFVGGNDAESDERLRNRLINSFKMLPNSINKQSIEDIVCTIDEVLDCHIYEINNVIKSVKVSVNTIYGYVNNDIIKKVNNKLLALNMLGYTSEVVGVARVSVNVDVVTNADPDEVQTACADYFDKLRIGDSVDLLSFRMWLSKRFDEPISDVRSSSATGQYIICDNNKLLRLDDVRVVPYD